MEARGSKSSDSNIHRNNNISKLKGKKGRNEGLRKEARK